MIRLTEGGQRLGCPKKLDLTLRSVGDSIEVHSILFEILWGGGKTYKIPIYIVTNKGTSSFEWEKRNKSLEAEVFRIRISQIWKRKRVWCHTGPGPTGVHFVKCGCLVTAARLRLTESCMSTVIGSKFCPGQVAQMVRVSSRYTKVVVSISGQGTYRK